MAWLFLQHKFINKDGFWQGVDEESSINKILVKVLHLVYGEKQGVEEVFSIKNILVKVLHLVNGKIPQWAICMKLYG